MSYASDAASITRQPLTIVEIGFDNVISPSGVERFTDGNVPIGQTFEPCLDDIQYSPTKITDAGLGYRCTTTISLQDFPHPSGVGTYFGRLIGANPYYVDRLITVYRGFEHSAFSLSNMKKAVYFIKKIDGPDEKGRVRITGADPLTLLDGDQAQMPLPSSGSLASGISNSFTGSIDIGDATNIAGGYAIIDSEIVSYTHTSGSLINITARGQLGTSAEAHDAEAPVRAIQYIDGNVVSFIYGAIWFFSEIDVSTYITLADWEFQRDTYLALESAYGVVLEPTPLKDTITKLCKQFNIAIWWDDEAQKIKLKALGPTLGASAQINTRDHILNVGHSVTRDQSKAISQVWIYYEKIDQSKGEDATNFKSVYAYADGSIEGSTGLRKPIIEKLYGEFIPGSGTASASKTASRISAQRKKGVIECKFRLDVRDATLAVGDGVEITTDLLQGADGNPVPTNFMVTERARKDSWVEYVAIATGIEIGNRYGVICSNSMADYTSASTADRNVYAWICNDAGEMSNSDSGYLIL